MATVRLTNAFCDAVKPSEKRQTSYRDPDVPGLELRVSGDGGKAWSFRYRTRLGRQARVTLGQHSPFFGLKDARDAARKLKVAVADGRDPANDLRIAKTEATTEHLKTFGDLAAEYFSATEKGRYRPKRASSLKLEKMVYRVHIEGILARMPLESVNRRLVKGALYRMLDRGVTGQAVRAQAIIRQILAYGVSEERLQFNCISSLPAVAPSNARLRVYSDAELKCIWAGVLAPEKLTVPSARANTRRDGTVVQVSRPMRIAIQLVMLLLQRRCEVLGMAKAELDLEHGIWTIPPGRMKQKRTHIVPLSPWAIELIKEAIALSADRESPFVFPGKNDPSKPMRGPSMNWAYNTILWALGIEDGTIHDLRRTGSTLMTSERMTVSPFIRSKVLGHYDAGGGAQVSATRYDANTYLREKRAALEQWQRLFRRIVGACNEADVLPRFDGPPKFSTDFAVSGGAMNFHQAPAFRLHASGAQV